MGNEGHITAGKGKGPLVVALGGNAITREHDTGSIPEQFVNTRHSLEPIVDIIAKGRQVVLTHGNGPQVGNYLIRVERARDEVPYLPLPIIVADLQGGMGYMIGQVLQGLLASKGASRPITTVLTQVLIDAEDSSLTDPSKFVGPFYEEYEAKELATKRGWVVKRDSNRGWRRVVASPYPLEIIEADIISDLIESGVVVVAAGGGGIPVRRVEGGYLQGVDGVIDKDRASAVLALDIGALELMILTSVSCVSLAYGTEDQRDLDRLTLEEARRYLAAGHFPPGNMGPKIESAIRFLEGGGERVFIGAVDQTGEILAGRSGTVVVQS